MIFKSLDYFFDQPVQNSVFVTCGIKLLRPILRLLCRVKLSGLRNLQTALESSKQRGSGLIIAANHRSNFDALLMLLETEQTLRLRPLAKAELFKLPIVGRVAAWEGAFPIQRGESDLKAIKRAVAILKRGEHLLIFPEGTRVAEYSSADAVSQISEAKAQAGVALIADMAKAAILPVHITKQSNPVATKINFGTVLDTSPFDESADKSHHYQAIADHLMQTIYSI